MTLLFEKVKKYGDFCAHAFVKYANNLYTSKILSLKIATTQPLIIFTNIRKIIINEDLSKAHTDHSKSKSVISKYSALHILPKPYALLKMPTWQRQLVQGLAATYSQNDQNRPKLTISQGLGQEPPKGPIWTEQIARACGLRVQMVKMRSFSRSHRRSKVVKMTKIWGPRHGFERLWAGPPAQRQLCTGPSHSLPQDPQKGSKMVKTGQI